MGVRGQRHVGVLGHVEGLPQHELLGRGGEEVLASQHVGDGHGAVIDGVGQHEERLAVPLHADEVLGRPVGELHDSTDQVDHRGGALVGGPESQAPAFARRQSTGTAEPVIAGRGVAGGGALPGALLDLLAGAVTGVQRAAGPEGVDGGLMGLPLGGLEVRALVGRHAQPVERRDDPVSPLRTIALLIGVFNPQDERPVVLASEEPVEQGRPGAPHVEVAGGGRGEANPRWGRGS